MKTLNYIIIISLFTLSLVLTGCPEKPEPPLDQTDMFPKKEGVIFETRIGGADIDSSVDIIITRDGGYMIAGYTHSRGKGKGDACLVKCSAEGKLEWSKVYGGPENDRVYSVVQTTDGGYAAAGRTDSYGAGKRDVYVIKVDENGEEEWQTYFGGPEEDEANRILQTEDNGFFLAGMTYSKGAGSGDVYLLKLNDKGTLLWEKTYGGKEKDTAAHAERTTDGGFIVCGSGGENTDCYILKLDDQGNREWEKFIGGAYFELANCITPVTGGGYVFAGMTQPEEGSKVDIYVVKINESGDIIWQKQIGGKDHSGAQYVIEGMDKSIIVSGATKNTESGNDNAFVIKFSPEGEFKWEETFGGKDIAYGNCVVEKSPGVYTLAGYILSTSEPSKGDFSIYFFSFKKD
ncbi:MAG: hypothetical protein JXJ04_09390 [Spirochaetales bacterium]|nr:hypothetical protein [Spirochaetales bacterium]